MIVPEVMSTILRLNGWRAQRTEVRTRNGELVRSLERRILRCHRGRDKWGECLPFDLVNLQLMLDLLVHEGLSMVGHASFGQAQGVSSMHFIAVRRRWDVLLMSKNHVAHLTVHAPPVLWCSMPGLRVHLLLEAVHCILVACEGRNGLRCVHVHGHIPVPRGEIMGAGPACQSGHALAVGNIGRLTGILRLVMVSCGVRAERKVKI